MKRFYLFPIDSRKSFYNKCYVEDKNGVLVCYSYNTPVAKFEQGKMFRLWGDYSATTMRHVNAFAAYCGIREGGKKWWNSLPIA